MLTEDYCSFELSKLLKEKGFKQEGCHKSYSMEGPVAPTHQMAMKWLRERHIIIVIVPAYFNSEQCASWDIDIWVDGDYNHLFKDYSTYEEAVEAAIKYCLINLI